MIPYSLGLIFSPFFFSYLGNWCGALRSATSKIIFTLNYPLFCRSYVRYRFLYNKSIFRAGASQIRKAVCIKMCYGYHCSRTNILYSGDGLHLMQLSESYGLTPAINKLRLHIRLQQSVFLSCVMMKT